MNVKGINKQLWVWLIAHRQCNLREQCSYKLSACMSKSLFKPNVLSIGVKLDKNNVYPYHVACTLKTTRRGIRLVRCAGLEHVLKYMFLYTPSAIRLKVHSDWRGASKSDQRRFSIEISREAHAPTRRDLTVHTDAIRIRPITTISDTIWKKMHERCIRRAHWTRVYVINYIWYM